MRRIRLAMTMALMLLVAGPSAFAQKTSTVEAQDNKFVPENITVQAGDTINFVNTGQAPHTAEDKAGSFNSGNLNPGDSKAITFSKEGSFQLICLYHEGLGMIGRIDVKAAGAPQPSPTPAAAGEATTAPTAPEPASKKFDPDEGVPIGMKVFPFLAGGLLLFLILAIAIGYIRTVQKTSESQ